MDPTTAPPTQQAIRGSSVPIISSPIETRFANYESLSDFDNEFPDERAVIRMLMEDGLLGKTMKCEQCDSDMNLQKWKSTFRWRCRFEGRRFGCSSSSSVRRGSQFENTKIPLRAIMRIGFMHHRQFTLEQISSDLNVPPKYVADYRNLFRKWNPSTTKPAEPQPAQHKQRCESVYAESPTPAEMNEIWDYVVANQDRYSDDSRVFWKDYIGNGRWKKCPRVLLTRFKEFIVPNLHKSHLDLRTKLRLYKKCHFPIDKGFLESLKSHKGLKVKTDDDLCVLYFSFTKVQPQKRKGSQEKEYVAKKTKKIPAVVESEDLIVMKVVPGTGVVNPESIIKMEAEDDSLPCSLEASEMSEESEIQKENVNEESVKITIKQEGMDYGDPLDWQRPSFEDGSVSMNSADESTIARFNALENQLNYVTQLLEKKSDGTPSNSSPMPINPSTKKDLLTSFKTWISTHGSPKSKEIEQQIDAALQICPEADEDPVEINKMFKAVEVALKIMAP